jgi:hypothetical protein
MKALLVLLILSVNPVTEKENPPPIPSYVLVYQYWGAVWGNNNDHFYSIPVSGTTLMSTGYEWIRNSVLFSSIEDALKFLREGSADRDVVGLWRLDACEKIDVRHRIIEHKKETKVEVQPWTEHVWEVKQ